MQGKLFDLGDTVVVKESDEMGIITHLGTNYVVVQITEEKSVRKWLDDVVKVELSEEILPKKLHSAIKTRSRKSYK